MNSSSSEKKDEGKIKTKLAKHHGNPWNLIFQVVHAQSLLLNPKSRSTGENASAHSLRATVALAPSGHPSFPPVITHFPWKAWAADSEGV